MRLLQKFAALIITLMIVIVAFLNYLDNLARMSIQESEESLSSSLIKNNINIYKNDYGIPHIIAANEYDAFFAAGYTHARDRMWQMDFSRRVGRGELSEIFGITTLEYDKFMRAFELDKISKKIYQSLDENTINVLKAYSDGINSYLEEKINYLPFEFNALAYVPKKWKPEDCIVISRMMAFELSVSFWTDIAFGEIAEKIGYEKALELIPSYPEDAPRVVEGLSKERRINSNSTFYELFTKDNHKQRSEIQDLLRAYAGLFNKVKDFTGIKGPIAGSNSWAIVKPLPDTINRYSVLANDPHLLLGIPARWYQMHISCPEFNVVGMTIPGAPFFLAGRNDHISWGITNIMMDDCDYFIEKVNPDNRDLYLSPKGDWKKFEFRRDTIRVKGLEDHEYYAKFTDRSAVLSDNHLLKYPDLVLKMPYDTNFRNVFFDKYCLTFSWTGQYVSKELPALYGLLKAINWEDFTESVIQWGAPGLNFTFADKIGNIGIQPAGFIPNRRQTIPQIPNPGWEKKYNWAGVIDTFLFPSIYNPENDFVSSANNEISRTIKEYISSFWEPASRAQRINDLLVEYTEFNTGYSARDAQIMQMDVLSPYAEKLLAHIFPILDNYSPKMSSNEKNALVKLKEWDFILSKQMGASSIYNMMLERLIYNTYHDELGERLYREYLFISNLPTRRILEMIEQYDLHWFDDINSKGYETRNDVIIKSFKQAVAKLDSIFKTSDVDKWEWGKIHKVTLEHILSRNKTLEPALNLGPFGMSGNNTTIYCSSWDYYKPFDVSVGSSMRFIADMQDSVVYTNIPGGTSGEVLSANYSDQVQLWLNGGYIALPVSKTPGKGFRLMTTINKE